MLNSTTQTCKKCQIEKPVSQFHRRRNGYQSTCKSCRNLIEAERYAQQGKIPLPRNTTPINSSNFAAMQTRIAELEPRLRAKAGAFAHDGMEADDLFSVMVEAILTKSQPEESDAYILQRANWAAQAHIAKNLNYGEYVGDLDMDEGELEKGGITIVSNPRAIEDAMIENETYAHITAVIASLPEENRQIVAMLSVGKKQREIAAELHVSEQTLSEKVKTIRASLQLQLA